MSQPVKLSDALVLDARLVGDFQERSIAGQVEFWAKLGRSVESLLNGDQVLALRRSAEAESISDALAIVDTPAGRKRVEEVIAGRPYPHFKQCPDRPGMLIRIQEDGAEAIGRFINRIFVPADSASSRSSGRPSRAARGVPKAKSAARPRARLRQNKSRAA
jgi:ParD-like antitoxin of type II bacterial toxin-antitoxin system